MIRDPRTISYPIGQKKNENKKLKKNHIFFKNKLDFLKTRKGYGGQLFFTQHLYPKDDLYQFAACSLKVVGLSPFYAKMPRTI